MKNHPLQEIAKVAAGLVIADFFSVLWFSQQNLLPIRSVGITLTQGMVMPALIFDVVLFFILVHYAWNIGKIPTVRERAYLTIAGIIFTIVAALHLWRLFSNAPLDLAGWSVPLWLSWIGVVITAYLAYTSFHFAARIKIKRSR